MRLACYRRDRTSRLIVFRNARNRINSKGDAGGVLLIRVREGLGELKKSADMQKQSREKILARGIEKN